MKKINKVIWLETFYIAAWTLIFSMLMQAVFLVIDWDYTVLLGNLLGAFAGVFNFFLLGVSVQKATASGDVKYAKGFMKLSQTGRMLFLLAIGVLGAVLSCFNLWATLISLFFPRIALLIRPLFFSREQKKALRAIRQGSSEEVDAIDEE